MRKFSSQKGSCDVNITLVHSKEMVLDARWRHSSSMIPLAPIFLEKKFKTKEIGLAADAKFKINRNPSNSLEQRKHLFVQEVAISHMDYDWNQPAIHQPAIHQPGYTPAWYTQF